MPREGNIGANDLAKALNYKLLNLHSNGIVNDQEIKSWADARLLKCRLARIRGRVKCEGRSDIKPGSMVKLVGWGDRFNGDAYVSAVRH